MQAKKHAGMYKDSDMLTAAQVAAVISENSDSVFDPVNVSHLVERGRIEGVQRFGDIWKYPYRSVKGLVVGRDRKVTGYRAGSSLPVASGDFLPAAQAAAIVSRNSGHVVNSRVLSAMARDGKIPGVRKFGTRYEYPGPFIRSLVIDRAAHGGRKKQDMPSAGAVRVRRHRARNGKGRL